MHPHLHLRAAGSLALAAALTLSIGGPGSTARAAEAMADTSIDAARATDGQSARPPATFFTINGVLARLDRQSGRGPDAIRLAKLTPPSPVVTDAQPAPALAPSVGEEPFRLFTFRAPDGVLWRKWRGLEADMAKDEIVLDRCRSGAEGCPSHAAQFLRLIDAVKSKSGRAQLEEANQGVNMAIRYVSDLAQFGELDRWSAPLDSFATAKGDCEDYAIAKYVALREAGFPENELRLLLVRDRNVGQDHAVLAAHLDDQWLILDNRWSELRDDSGSLNFTPLFAINHAGVFLFAAPYAKAHALDGEADAAPAAASEDATEWTNSESNGGSGSGIAAPLFL